MPADVMWESRSPCGLSRFPTHDAFHHAFQSLFFLSPLFGAPKGVACLYVRDGGDLPRWGWGARQRS